MTALGVDMMWFLRCRWVALLPTTLLACGAPSQGDGPGDGGPPDVLQPTDAMAEPEAGPFELPRIPVDPKLTRRIVAGETAIMGDGGTTCSHAIPASGDRWCAFSLRASETKTELWVLNVTQAVEPASTTCDGTSPNCLRLSEDIWTEFTFWGPTYPLTHRFEGDTLIFHERPVQAKWVPYEGAISAWRPGWTTARRLTSELGAFCFAQPHTTAVGCIDHAVIKKDQTDLFDPPHFLAGDLLAGVLTDATTGPLPKVTRIVEGATDFAWRARFSAEGDYLAYSSVDVASSVESLHLVKTADIGRAPPTTILSDVTNWEISHDGSKLYYLKGYDRALGEEASGTLMLADFPSALNSTELKQSVYAFGLLGWQNQVFSALDRGAILAYGAPGRPRRLALLKDPAAPSSVFDLDPSASGVRVSTDIRHTFFYKDVTANPLAFIARNDGTGNCQLTLDDRAETYNAYFTDSGTRVAWIEYGGNGSEEGWHAQPETCGDKTKFGDYVFDYRLVDDDFVVFEGGDRDDSTSWLQYTPLKKVPGGPNPLPAEIKERPNSFAPVRVGAESWVLFSVSEGDEAEHGLYLHGPLRAASP